MAPLLKRSLFIGFACIASGVGAVRALAAGAEAAEHQSAVWQERKVSFAFLGFTATYSCDGLADKLKTLLLAAGARKDVQARPGACSGFGRPDKFASADLTFFTLVPAGAGTADAVSVDGIWRPVAFAARRPRELATGDCELVEQFKSDVLPLFSTRQVEEHTTCVPYQDSGSVIDLKFESLGAAVQKPERPPGRP